jgi:hypothetical protein
MRARGIGLGFAHHQHPRHFVCPGLGVIQISRETPGRHHPKRRAANFNALPSPPLSVQSGPYQYAAPAVQTSCDPSHALGDPAVPIDNAYLDEGFLEPFLYSPSPTPDNPYQAGC